MPIELFATQQGSFSAELTRRAIFANYARTAANSPGVIAGGLIGAGDLALSAPASGMSVNVAAGEAILGGGEGGAQGAYYLRNTAQANLAITAANATNPRVDTIVASIADQGYVEPSDVGSTANGGVLAVVTGTPTAGATLANLSGAAAVPLSSLLLGYVLVPASSTNVTAGNISNVAGIVEVLPALSPGGLTGASTASSRYVGATTSGPPSSGTFAKGDFIIDQTGSIWVCTTAGSPGSWTSQITSSGSVVGTGNLAPPTNTHTAIPGLTVTTPSIVSGQVLVVWLSVYLSASSNTVSARLTRGGVETGIQLDSTSTGVAMTVQRFTGLTGTQTLAANGWATSGVGTILGTSSTIAYQVQGS